MRGAAPLTLTLLACAPAGSTVVAPPTEGARVLAIKSEGSVRFSSAEAGAMEAHELVADEGSIAELYAYDGTLASRRVPVGELAPDAAGVALPAPVARHVLDASVDPPVWREGAVTPLLDELRVVRVSPCRRFTGRVVELSQGQAVFLEPLPDGRMLHGLTRPDVTLALHAIGGPDAIEALGVITAPEITAGVVAEGALWLGDAQGRILRAPLTAPTETATVARTPSGQILYGLLVRTGTAGPEIFALSGAGTLERYRSGRWDTLRARPADENRETGALLTSTGERLFVTPLDREVLVERDGALSGEPINSAQAPVSLGLLRGAPAVGLNGGAIATRRGGQWHESIALGTSLEVFSMLDLEGGVLIGGGDGLLVEWNDELGAACPYPDFDRSGGYRFLRRLGDTILAAGYPSLSRGQARLTFLR